MSSRIEQLSNDRSRQHNQGDASPTRPFPASLSQPLWLCGVTVRRLDLANPFRACCTPPASPTRPFSASSSQGAATPRAPRHCQRRGHRTCALEALAIPAPPLRRRRRQCRGPRSCERAMPSPGHVLKGPRGAADPALRGFSCPSLWSRALHCRCSPPVVPAISRRTPRPAPLRGRQQVLAHAGEHLRVSGGRVEAEPPH